MKHVTLIFLFSLLCSLTYAQDKALKKRVVKFHKIVADRNLNEEDKTIKLKEYILPGAQNDSMAHYFSKSWSQFNKSSKSVKATFERIEILPGNADAIITIKDVVTYASGEQAVFISKTTWVKENDIWYRSYEKSELYKNGKRIR